MWRVLASFNIIMASFDMHFLRNAPLGSAVCTFTFGLQSRDLSNVFEGKYMEQTGENELTPVNNYNPFTVSTEQYSSG